MSNTATRLITLIMLLQRRPNQKAGELAAALGVSVRSLHRYMAMLEEIGIPIYSERGPQGGFSLVRGYKMPPLVFTPEEAVAVYLGASLVAEMWGRLYEEAATGALAKLDNVLPAEQRHEVAWARRKLVTTGLHRGRNRWRPCWRSCAGRERRRVRMVYRSRNQPQPVERIFDPYALVHRWGWWYHGSFPSTHRRAGAARRDLRRRRLRHPAYLATDMRFQPTLHVRMRFPPHFAQVALDDRTQWETVEEQPDGSVIVSLPATDWSGPPAPCWPTVARPLSWRPRSCATW